MLGYGGAVKGRPGGRGGGGALEGQVAYLGRELEEQVVGEGRLDKQVVGAVARGTGLEVAKEGRWGSCGSGGGLKEGGRVRRAREIGERV